MIRFNSVWVTTPSQLRRYRRELELPASRQTEDFPRMRLLLLKKPIPFVAYGELTLGEKGVAFKPLRPTFSSGAVYQFYHFNQPPLIFQYLYEELDVRCLPQPVPNPLPVYGDWVRLLCRKTSIEYLLASSSPGAELCPWLERMIHRK